MHKNCHTVIVAGDFNINSRYYSYLNAEEDCHVILFHAILNCFRLKPADSGEPTRGTNTIDYILFMENVECKDYNVSPCRVSDHNRLEALLQIDPTSVLDFVRKRLLKEWLKFNPTIFHQNFDELQCWFDILKDIMGTISLPIAILMTIHQPPARIFNLFHKVYMLSTIGKAIYEGSPKNVVPTLANYNVQCSQFYNPADLLIEVASGDFGLPVINSMVININKGTNQGTLPTLPLLAYDTFPMDKALVRPITPFWAHFWILWERLTLITLRDPILTALRIAFALNAALCISLVYADLTQGSGCPPSPPSISSVIAGTGLPPFQSSLAESKKQTFEVVASFFFILLYTTFGNIVPTATTYPLEIMVFQKERYNGWYSPMSYAMAKLFVDLPFIFITNFMVMGIFFAITGQPMDRFWSACLIYFLLGLIAVSHCSLVGIIFRYNVVASVFTAPNSAVPFALFSGFFIRLQAMPAFFAFICRLCYFHYGFVGYVTAMFGFNRCNHTEIDKLLHLQGDLSNFLYQTFRVAEITLADDDESVFNNTRAKTLVSSIVGEISGDLSIDKDDIKSGPMIYYGFNDYDYFVAIGALLATFIALRVICIILLKRLATLKN